MSEFKLSIKNITYLFNQNLVRLIISLFVGAAVARYLGVELYGKYSFVLSFLFLYKPLISFGLDELLLSKINDSKDINTLFGTSFVLRLLTFFVFFLISIPTLKLINIDQETYYLTILFITSMISVPFTNCELYLNAKLKIKKQASLKSVLFIALAFLKIYFIYIKLPLLSFVIISIAEIIGMAIISLVIYQRKYSEYSMFKWKFSYVLSKSLLIESFPLMLSLVVFRSMSKIDQMFIANFKSMNDLGYYGAAAKLLDTWQFLPAIISTIYLPKISKDKRYESEYFFILSVSSISLVIGCYLFGEFVIKVFYGHAFLAATTFLKYYSVQFYFLFFALARVNVMLKDQKTSFNLILSTFILILNLLLNYYFILEYGSIGVIWASILANIVGLGLFSLINYEFRKLIKSYILSIFYLFTR